MTLMSTFREYESQEKHGKTLHVCQNLSYAFRPITEQGFIQRGIVLTGTKFEIANQ